MPSNVKANTALTTSYTQFNLEPRAVSMTQVPLLPLSYRYRDRDEDEIHLHLGQCDSISTLCHCTFLFLFFWNQESNSGLHSWEAGTLSLS